MESSDKIVKEFLNFKNQKENCTIYKFDLDYNNKYLKYVGDIIENNEMFNKHNKITLIYGYIENINTQHRYFVTGIKDKRDGRMSLSFKNIDRRYVDLCLNISKEQDKYIVESFGYYGDNSIDYLSLLETNDVNVTINKLEYEDKKVDKSKRKILNYSMEICNN